MVFPTLEVYLVARYNARMDAGVLLRALELAAERHRHQRRKDSEKSPYINHPIQVVTILWESGVRDEIALIAAVLHDTIEDTATTRDEIAAAFGEAVAAVVEEVSDDKSLPKERRKELQVEHASRLSIAAKLVKIADKTCNLRDMNERPPPDWSEERRAEYYAWAARVVAEIRGTHAELERRFDIEMARRP